MSSLATSRVFEGQVQNPASEEALVRTAQAGAVEAFEILAQRHVKIVIGLVRQQVSDGHLAEDLSQEVLLIAFRSLPQLDDPAKFSAWLYRIAIREARRGRTRSEPPVTRPELVSGEREALRRTEREIAVREAVGALEEPYRLAVTLRYLEGLTAVEIAKRLNVPEGTVRAQLSRAMPLLREKLGRHL